MILRHHFFRAETLFFLKKRILFILTIAKNWVQRPNLKRVDLPPSKLLELIIDSIDPENKL